MQAELSPVCWKAAVEREVEHEWTVEREVAHEWTQQCMLSNTSERI